MMNSSLVVMLAAAIYAPMEAQQKWVPYTSKDGNFMVDFPGTPKTLTRAARTARGQIKVVIAQCDTPDVLYTAERIDIPPTPGQMKKDDADAILDYWANDMAHDLNGKIIAQKNITLGPGSYGRDFTIEARPDPKGGVATTRVREYLSAKTLYMFFASTALDRDLPDDVGHFFASFTVGTTRTNKMGPYPEIKGKPLGKWGYAIDPDGDCKIVEKGKALQIDIPNTHHDLNADNDKLNAPRVVKEVTGDFSITVKVVGTLQPSDKSTNPKAVPYAGAGILIWQDSDNYIFLGRAGMNRRGKVNYMIAFEEREWGTRGAVNNKGGIEPGDVFLRLERKGNRMLGSISKDGKSWTKLDSMEPGYPATLKVGLYALNGSTDPLAVQFQNYEFTAGKATAAKKKR